MDPTKIILDSGNWKDFKAKLSKLEPKEKGDCFELLTKAFLETDPRYTTKLQYVWHHSKVPTKTRKKLNLPAQDEGIDLVAKNRHATYNVSVLKDPWRYSQCHGLLINFHPVGSSNVASTILAPSPIKKGRKPV